MKISKIIAVIIVIVVSVPFGFAQNAALGLDEYIKHARVDNKMEKPVLYEYVQGSCYLNDNFIDGRMTLDIGKTYEGPIRYDMYADQIEFKNSANEIFILQNPGAVRMVILDTLQFNYFEPGVFKDIQGFYEILLIGDYSLYKKYQIFLKNPDSAGPGIYANAAMFIPQDSKYYIMDPDANFKEIRNKKDLLLSDTNTDELEEFIKNNKIKVRKEKDLIRFTEFLNQ